MSMTNTSQRAIDSTPKTSTDITSGKESSLSVRSKALIRISDIIDLSNSERYYKDEDFEYVAPGLKRFKMAIAG